MGLTLLPAPPITPSQGWDNGNFIAVQWRTEMSEGDLTACYAEVNGQEGDRIIFETCHTFIFDALKIEDHL